MDDVKDGRSQIAPTCEGATTKQLYWPGIDIPVTRFLSPGEVAEFVDLDNKYGAPISYDLWQKVRRLLSWLCDNWERLTRASGGQGRPPAERYSKVVCCVALDRGARLAEKRSSPSERERWLKERDRIYDEVMERGWSEGRGAFVQSYASDALDAATLIMPPVFFLSLTDPWMLRTLGAIQKSPVDGACSRTAFVPL